MALDDIRLRRVFIEQEDSGEERRRREHKRLDALIGYCETAQCRRQALLTYFGETTGPCGNCDTCLEPVEMVEGTREAQMALSAVYRTGQRFGGAHIIDVLRGNLTEKVAKAGHDRLPTFGVGEALKKDAWQSLLRQLVAGGYLRLDIQGYGGLALGGPGRELLRGEGQFHYRQDAVRRPAKAAKAAKEVVPEDPLTAEQEALLAELKELRLKLAKQRRVPAYIIFSDRSLADMARRAPRSAEEFAQVHGVGAAKLKDFAETFLVAIAAHGEGVPHA